MDEDFNQFLNIDPTSDIDQGELGEFFERIQSFMGRVPQLQYVVPEPDKFFDALSSPTSSPEEIEALIKAGANPNAVRAAEYETHQHALAVAVKTGNPAVVEVLLRYGADATFSTDAGYSIIVKACYGPGTWSNPGLIPILQQLVEHGADVNSETIYGETPLRILTRFARYDAIGFLIDYGASTKSITWTDLHQAAALGTLKEVQNLVQQGYDLNAKDWQDRTPVMIALQLGDLEKVRRLVELGAGFETTPKSKASPFECAVQSLNPELLLYYLNLGIEYVPTSKADYGPIQTALEYGNEEMARVTYEYYSESPYVQKYLNEALKEDDDGRYAKWLLDIGAKSINLRPTARRVLLGHAQEIEDPLDGISEEQYQNERSPRFGTSNPEEAN